MPLSPPLSSSGDILQQGFQHLVQHNMAISYPAQDSYDDGSHLHSRYDSPTATEGDDSAYIYHGGHPRYNYSSHSSDLGMVTPYESAYSPNYQSSAYQDRYSTPATSPPQHMDTLRTRSGLGIPRGHQPLRPMPEGRARNKESPNRKKIKKERTKAEKKVAKLEQPLSVLTKDWKHVPIVDIDAYVNRSAEVRRKEVEEGKTPGKVKRPMNSFMLYRKAYQNRTKDWCLQNNHQVVSQVCGDSWPLEPDEVKDQFSEWARIERINHQNAHPGYKFSPNKPGSAKSAKRKMSENPMSEESDLDDFDWRGGSSSRRSKKSRSTPRAIVQSSPQAVSYPSTRSAYQYSSRENSLDPMQGRYHRSSYQANNPGRHPPAVYQTHLQNGEYYQQSVQNYHGIPGAQDVVLKKTSTEGMAPSYLGLPGAGGHNYNIMHPYPHYDQYPPQHRIDPSLMGADQHPFDSSHFGDSSQDAYSLPGSHEAIDWQQPLYDMGNRGQRQDPIIPFLDAEQNLEHIHDPHMNVLGDHKEGWHVETLETENEFDKWMDEHPAAP